MIQDFTLVYPLVALRHSKAVRTARGAQQRRCPAACASRPFALLGSPRPGLLVLKGGESISVGVRSAQEGLY